MLSDGDLVAERKAIKATHEKLEVQAGGKYYLVDAAWFNSWKDWVSGMTYEEVVRLKGLFGYPRQRATCGGARDQEPKRVACDPSLTLYVLCARACLYSGACQVGYDGPDEFPESRGARPGPIDNRALLETGSDTRLLPRIREVRPWLAADLLVCLLACRWLAAGLPQADCNPTPCAVPRLTRLVCRQGVDYELVSAPEWARLAEWYSPPGAPCGPPILRRGVADGG